MSPHCCDKPRIQGCDAGAGFLPGLAGSLASGIRPSPRCLSGARTEAGGPPQAPGSPIDAAVLPPLHVSCWVCWRRCDSSRLRAFLLCPPSLLPAHSRRGPLLLSFSSSSSSLLGTGSGGWFLGGLGLSVAPCLNTSSRPGLPPSRVPFPVHADRGLHEAGMSECIGDPCTG